MKYINIKKEEELKGKVGKDWFNNFDDTRILGNIDFCISPKIKAHNKKTELESFLWAEAKTGDFDVISMFAQLIITIGKERTFDKHLPPAFLGAFDYKKIVFVPYNLIVDIFFINDFNWNVAPSNHNTKEFNIIKDRIENILQKHTYQFDFFEDENELVHFIKNNLSNSSEGGKILIDKNNFVPIYLRWLTQVKPYINFDWIEGKKQNILDSDFFLADLFIDDHGTSNIDDDTPLKEELFIVFKNSHYEIAKESLKSLFNAIIKIKDKDKYEQFWKKYKRSPVKDFQQYIVDRRDLLMPQDIRERKGAFFTPQIWVELSQKYLSDTLGVNWQNEYVVWDCAAGTGNLLAGLTNKYNIYASTLDQADVNVMKDRISNGANLLEDHVFQFDFLNDDFNILPLGLKNIIDNPEKRKKLIIYINPPYAEASDKKTLQFKLGKGGVEQSKTNKKYASILGQGNAEIFAQFLIRINKEINGAFIAEFSTLKILQGQHFIDFRNNFLANLNKMFIVPADTFDNVKGKFPIGFMIWDSCIPEKFKSIVADVYDKDGNFIQTKFITSYEDVNYMNEWIKPYRADKNDPLLIGKFPFKGNDFQNQNMIAIVHHNMMYNKEAGQFLINFNNLIYASVYFAVKKCIDATWLNDRDQFLFPNNQWEKDYVFQNDCLTFTLFNNNIQSKYGINHWLPFTEYEVNSRTKFDSNLMTTFINGLIKIESKYDLFNDQQFNQKLPLDFSTEAADVFDSARELWKYYHCQFNVNVNASLYDIREYFQGRNSIGKMNLRSDNEEYMSLIVNLRSKLKVLGNKISPKVYKYGFLK